MDNEERFLKLEKRISVIEKSLNKESKIESIKQAIITESFMTKEDLCNKFEVRRSNTRLWQGIIESLKLDSKFTVIQGLGRAGTLIGYTGELNNPIRIGIKHFSEMGKSQECNKETLMKRYNIKEDLSLITYRFIVKQFKERVKETETGPKMFKKKY